MKQLLTKSQVNSRYKGRYIEFYQTYNYQKQCNMYEIRNTFDEIHENTTLGEDVGTRFEYRRWITI